MISFPGGGASSSGWYGYMNHGAILNSLGYAVLIVQGWSVDWCHDKIGQSTNSVHPVGNWMALEEAVKAYQYLINKYDWIDRDGVYLYGESQGGCLAENFAELSGIPVLATALDSPVTSLRYHMWNFRQTAINAFYDIDSDNWDDSKTLGCDPFTRNMDGIIVGTDISSGVTGSVEYDSVTAKKFRGCNSPLLILLGENDSIIGPSVTKAYVKALENAGFLCDLKLYNLPNTTGHGIIQYTSVVGVVNSINITAGLIQILEFYKRCGGYSYEFIQNE